MAIDVRAVLLGAAADLGGTSFFGSILTISWAHVLLSQGVRIEQIYPDIITSPWFLLASSIVGLGFSFLGGHIAASIAQRHHSAYGAASAIPCVITGIIEFMSPFDSMLPVWLVWSGKLASVLFAFLGGRYAGAAQLRI